MAAGANALGFGGGFAKGFANALVEGRRVAREEQHRKEEQRMREFGVVFPLIYKEAEDTGDFTRANEIVGEYMPDIGKTMKKRGVDLGSIIAPSSQVTQPTKGLTSATQQGFEQGSTAQMEAGGPPLLESRPLVSPTTPEPPPAPGSQFLGMPMTTPTQKIEAKTKAARRFSQANPDVPLITAFKMFGLDVPSTALSAGSIQSVAGEMPDGSPAFGILDRRPTSPTFGKYLDADTQQPLEGFQPRTSTASTSLGQMAERAAKALGFANATAAARAGKMNDVNAKVQELQQAESFARGTGTGRAAIQTELDKPIGTTAAQIYNVAPTTTMRQLQGTIALRPEQQEQIRSLGQVDALLTEIEQTLPTVFPDVEPGIWGRLQTQFSLGAQKLGADEDLAQLDAAINAALAQVAQLSGQPGSRLSDRDIELAKSTLVQLEPKIFGGDTLATAQSRLGVLRRLLEKAKGGLPARTVAPGAPGAPANAPGAASPAAAAPGAGSPTGFFMDANGNITNGPNGQVVIPAH